MRKNYIYVVLLVLLMFILWVGYYLYMEYNPVAYQNGILVEVPKETMLEFTA